MKKDRLDPNTVRAYLLVLRSVLRQAMLDDLIDLKVYERLTVKKYRAREINYLSIEDLRVLQTTPCRYPVLAQAFLFTCFAGGIRLSDVESLKWRQIDLQKREMAIHQQKTGNTLIVPLSEQAIKLLPARASDDRSSAGDLVFPIGVTRGPIASAMRQWGSAAGLGHLHFHMSRHTFAMLALESGIDLLTVSKLLDHSDVSTTTRYLHILEQRKRRAVDQMATL